MKEVLLSQRGKNKGKYVALVDDEDFERVNQFKWSVSINHTSVYASRKLKDNDKVTIQYMHQFLLETNWGDHIDGNGLNNQRYNLRKATHHQNQMNRRSHIKSSSIYKGVRWIESRKYWRAHIRFNKRLIHLGVFINEVDAAKAYDEKAKELFKDFASLNFKD